MSHPRYSVLNLFDPLNATPRREVTTPDSLSSSTSDKENAEPSSSNAHNNYYESDKLTMTAFFNRAYKMQPKHYSPVALRKRLIDVGDITVDDASELMGGLTIAEENEGEELNDSFNDEDMQLDDLQSDDALMTPQPKAPSRERYGALQTPHSSGSSHIQQQETPNASRTPLADLSLDATPMPRKTGKALASVFDASTPATSTEQDCSSPVTVVRASHASVAPIGSPLASVINAINLAEHEDEEIVTSHTSKQNQAITVVISEPPDTDDTLNLANACLPSSSTAPLLSETCPPESTTSLASVPQDLPAVQDSQPLGPSIEDDPTYLSARPRPRLRSKTVSATTPSFDAHRSSVDLQISFNWQLQCPEASFDLLNDRVSFFGGDSFLADTTDDFDAKAEEEMMEALARRLREKEAAVIKDASTASAANRRRSGTDVGALDYTPSSPIVTEVSQALEKLGASPSSSLVDSMPATVVKPPRRRSLLANLISSPNAEPSPVSRRGSLPLAERERSPETAPVFQPPQALLQTSPPLPQSPPRVVSSTAFSETHESCPAPEAQPMPSITPVKSSVVKPAPVPAPVQALRIVKRPKASVLAQHHERAASASSSATDESGGGDAEVHTHPQGQVSLPAVSRVAHKSMFKGVQRPPPGYIAPPMLAPPAIGAKPASTLLAKHVAPAEQEGKAAKVSVKSKLTGVLGLRGRTVPEPEATAPTQSRIQKPVATAATLGRAPASSTAQTSTSSKSSVPAHGTGLRPPSRFATVSAASSSGIPRPTSSSNSRLPGPTFGVPRSRLPGVGGNASAVTVGRSGTVRR
ncbi:hypothetical protein F5I97DRAFT_2074713 [Phlebopus sp. FC_14]|nr:hypothetical protein F5I97DRAFT_2074713 [Phlebopus sp. FC_14]